jgi:hypothetical protein
MTTTTALSGAMGPAPATSPQPHGRRLVVLEPLPTDSAVALLEEALEIGINWPRAAPDAVAAAAHMVFLAHAEQGSPSEPAWRRLAQAACAELAAEAAAAGLRVLWGRHERETGWPALPTLAKAVLRIVPVEVASIAARL